jgi:hypothetical protein
MQIVGHEAIITAKPAAHPVVILGSLDSSAIMLMAGPIPMLALLAAVASKFAPRAVSHPVAASHLLTKQLAIVFLLVY